MTFHSFTSRTSLLFGVFLMGCMIVSAACSQPRSGKLTSDSPSAPASVRETADDVLDALRIKDGDRLATYVHPEKGVRFSPSAYIDVAKDVVLKRDRIREFWTDTVVYHWGYAEGSGAPIALTPAAYAERYILDRDYAKASFVSVNDDRAVGTTRNNVTEVYAGASRLEYYIEAGSGTELNDWTALRLVFEKVGDSWFLIAVIHDAWSP